LYSDDLAHCDIQIVSLFKYGSLSLTYTVRENLGLYRFQQLPSSLGTSAEKVVRGYRESKDERDAQDNGEKAEVFRVNLMTQQCHHCPW